MPLHRLAMRIAFCALPASILAACSTHAGGPLPSTAFAPPAVALPDAGPPACKGQKTTKNYASLTVTLSTKGGTFCIPAYGGFGGSVSYPGANPSVKLNLISSTKNYNHLPQLGKGTAIFYLQLALSGGTSFGSHVQAGGGLTAKKIVPGKPYTAYGQATISGFTFPFGPCYAVAKKGKYGGVIGGIGTLLKGQTIFAAASGLIEIYSGKQTSTKC
ncbi:MAG: hypothetical protein JO347_00545 [Candidatus Eremiobacteraeota bacterium]|nr:hypothetical protein [Candidatus Eremiobacteraeota bacterium]